MIVLVEKVVYGLMVVLVVELFGGVYGGSCWAVGGVNGCGERVGSCRESAGCEGKCGGGSVYISYIDSKVYCLRPNIQDMDLLVCGLRGISTRADENACMYIAFKKKPLPLTAF